MTMLREHGPYMNLGVLVGHSAVRTAVMGEDASVYYVANSVMVDAGQKAGRVLI